MFCTNSYRKGFMRANYKICNQFRQAGVDYGCCGWRCWSSMDVPKISHIHYDWARCTIFTIEKIADSQTSLVRQQMAENITFIHLKNICPSPATWRKVSSQNAGTSHTRCIHHASSNHQHNSHSPPFSLNINIIKHLHHLGLYPGQYPSAALPGGVIAFHNRL